MRTLTLTHWYTVISILPIFASTGKFLKIVLVVKFCKSTKKLTTQNMHLLHTNTNSTHKDSPHFVNDTSMHCYCITICWFLKSKCCLTCGGSGTKTGQSVVLESDLHMWRIWYQNWSKCSLGIRPSHVEDLVPKLVQV